MERLDKIKWIAFIEENGKSAFEWNMCTWDRTDLKLRKLKKRMIFIVATKNVYTPEKWQKKRIKHNNNDISELRLCVCVKRRGRGWRSKMIAMIRKKDFFYQLKEWTMNYIRWLTIWNNDQFNCNILTTHPNAIAGNRRFCSHSNGS